MNVLGSELVGFLSRPTRHLFFTGKGGVGKTSLSTAAALMLADAGKKVLLVSTDAASNLDEVLGIELRNTPVPVPGAPGLSVLNIDPDTAAESYRQRVLAQMGAGASETERATYREPLSGAFTTEIASFDEFASLLHDDAGHFDHIVFDTAPTGHTLRLLSLPKASSGFLYGNDRGASCLGPHSGLKMLEARFKAALDALSDPRQTTVILVTRPDKGAIAEAARSSQELHELGLNNQRLAINGMFHASVRSDAVACAIEDLGQQALADMPQSPRGLPQDRVPLRSFDTVGLPALRALLASGPEPIGSRSKVIAEDSELAERAEHHDARRGPARRGDLLPQSRRLHRGAHRRLRLGRALRRHHHQRLRAHGRLVRGGPSVHGRGAGGHHGHIRDRDQPTLPRQHGEPVARSASSARKDSEGQ